MVQTASLPLMVNLGAIRLACQSDTWDLYTSKKGRSHHSSQFSCSSADWGQTDGRGARRVMPKLALPEHLEPFNLEVSTLVSCTDKFLLFESVHPLFPGCDCNSPLED